MIEIAEAPPTCLYPTAPLTLEEAGLGFELVTELVLKALHGSSALSGAEVAKRVGLGFTIVEPSLELLKGQHYCEIVAGPVLGGASFRYRLTDVGHQRALAALDRTHYGGLAPVPIAQYVRYMSEFQRSIAQRITANDVRQAFSHLVVSERVINEIGPAVAAGQSIFLYGAAGNGKTVMAHAIRGLLPGNIAIPHALEVAGHIIRFFDPTVHEPVGQPADEEDGGVRYDRRWIQCRRPMVAVGGELTLEALTLSYNPRSGVYWAPVQALANGGILLVDEFGRQRCPPRDLLNWWMVPLESRVEYLTLHSGEKLEMPFLALLIFSTNLRPSDLVDEAFLRRIQYKIYAENPTAESFIRMFERCCDERGIAFERALAEDLLTGFFRERRLELRACYPRDLIDRALSLASYHGQPRALTSQLLMAACLSYFIKDHEASRSAP